MKKPSANYGGYDFSLTTLDGKTIRLSDFVGKVVLVNLWSPQHAPCVREARGFARLYEQYHAKGFEIVGVAIQTNESAVRAFMEKYDVAWHVGIKDGIAKQYRSYGLPDSYLFLPDGKLLKHFIGYTREEVLKPYIDDALKRVSVQH